MVSNYIGIDMIGIKFSLIELEIMIEVLERTPHDNTVENSLREDLRNIRKRVEDQKVKAEQDARDKPDEELRLIPNPTSAEHIK
tara:strand:- start:598 stop:849 length:252 start_codon:yes stop_codon:yes gene_type:complete